MIHRSLVTWVGALLFVLPATCAHATDRVFEDRVFAMEDWTFEVFTGGFGGSAEVFRDLEPGGLPSPYRVVRVTLNAPSSTVGSVVHTFSGNLRARHNPSKDGEIFAINYSDYGRQIWPPDAQIGNGLRVALGLKQGTNYFSAPEPVLYASADAWTEHEQNSLTAADFVPLAGSLQTARPDFSTNGTEILFGFFRANSTPAGSYPNSIPGTPMGAYDSGIDNWRVELLLTDPGYTNKLPRAGRRLETYALRDDHPTWPEPVLEAIDTRVEPAPLLSLTNEMVATAIVTGVAGTTGTGVASAQARAAVFSGVRTTARGGVTIAPLQPRERRAQATSRDIRHFVARAPHGVTNAVINLWMLADGFFELMPFYIGNPWEPYGSQLAASAEQTVTLHRESQTRTIMRGAARVHRQVGNPSTRIFTEGSWQGAVTLQFNESMTYRRPTLDYSEVMLDVATVPVGEPFALEFRLRAESKAGDEAADWFATADLYNTAGYTVQSSTPEVEIIEITPVENRPRLAVRRQAGLIELFTTDDPGEGEFIVEYLAGLIGWEMLGAMSASNGQWTLADVGNQPTRFYRLVRRPKASP